MSGSFDIDDSYAGVFQQHKTHIHGVAISHLREWPDVVAVIVDVAETATVQAVDGFTDIETARETLRELASSANRRVFLVLRPEGVDLTRPASPPDVDVEWIDSAQS